MKQLTFAVPNSVSSVLYEIENLRHTGKLSALACRLLEMFYVTGWDDGFVQFERRELCTALGARMADADAAIAELEALCLIAVRRTVSHEVVEITAFSTPGLSGIAEICWWQYYRVAFDEFWFEVRDDARDRDEPQGKQ